MLGFVTPLSHLRNILAAVTVTFFLISAEFALAQTMPGLMSIEHIPRDIPKLDLVVEALSYTPYFYAGRAEPTAGNGVRLTALSPGITASSYQWSIGGSRHSTTGPFTVSTLPVIKDRVLIEVWAFDKNGDTVAKTAEYVSFSTPRILFYEDNALRGTSKNAVQASLIMIGQEVSVKAEPYFAGTNSFTDLEASWSVDLAADTSSDDWRFLHITRGENDPERSTVSLNVRNPRNLNEYLSATFQLEI